MAIKVVTDLEDHFLSRKAEVERLFQDTALTI